jgi:hypothetical protein
MTTRLNAFRTAHGDEYDKTRRQHYYCIDPISHFSSKGADLMPKLELPLLSCSKTRSC